MKKKQPYGGFLIYLRKTMRIMRLSLFLIVISTAMAFSANSYSQNAKLTMDMNNVTVKEVIKAIENQSEFLFFYQEKHVDLNRRVTIYANEQDVETILDQIFAGTDNIYVINDRQIVFGIAPRKELEKQIQNIKGNVKPVIDQFQKKDIKGKVTDVDGISLPGVSVIVKGTTLGTVTNPDGEFSLNVPLDAEILQFSFVGMATQEIAIDEKATFAVVMEEDFVGIEEVVAVGYGTMKKSDLTGSVGSIKADEIQKVSASSFENSLAGRLAGLQVTTKEGAPGSGLDITIRGGTSLNASNAPLYVVDGYPILGENESMGSEMGGQGVTTQSPLITLNPSDIESIEILKDASSTAIYGARGANGVIIITTKDGQRDKTPTVTFNSYVGVQELPKKLNMLNGADFAALMTEVFPDDSAYVNKETGQIKTGPSRNWQDEIYRTAIVQNYQLSITGGTKSTAYAVSVGYYNQEGIVKGSEFDRYTANLRLNTGISDKLRFGMNTNFGLTQNQGIVSATQGALSFQNGATFYGLFYRPIFPVGRDNALDEENEDINNVNPLTLVERVVQNNNTHRILGNFFGEYDILDGLKLKISLGGTINATKIDQYNPGDFGVGRAQGGAIVTLTQRQSLNWLNENTLSYNKTFNDIHRFNIVAGYTQQKDIFESMRTQAIGFPLETPDNLDNIGTAETTRASASTRTEWGLQSFLNRINYTLLDRYLFTFTFRADGSSRFAEGHKWGYFPSGAFAWRASDEAFMDNLPVISDLKLRASYGLTGNQEIGLYQSLSALQQANYNFDDMLTIGFAPNRIANPNLTWESTEQVDLGLNLGLFDNKLLFELDLYQKNTRDLLLAVPVPYTSGYSTALQNLGEVRNRGVEARLTNINISNKDFSWSTDLNITMNRNKVISLGDEATEFYANGARWNVTSDFVIREGEPVGSIVGYKMDGVYQFEDFDDDGSGNLTLKPGVAYFTGSNPVPGDIKYLDTTGDTVVNSLDRQILGSANPKHYGGITNNFTYKNWDLSVFMQWSYGNETYNSTRMTGFYTDGYNNKFEEIKNRWTPDNPTNELWSYTGGPQEGILTDFFIEDGSFVRLSNVTLGYSLPKSLLSRAKINSLRFYLSGDNLALFTKYKGYDPDVSVRRDPLTPGIDFGAYPRARTVRFGLIMNL